MNDEVSCGQAAQRSATTGFAWLGNRPHEAAEADLSFKSERNANHRVRLCKSS
jgi:hypothetical protein